MRVSRIGCAVSLGLTSVLMLALWFRSQRPEARGVRVPLEPEASPLLVVADGCRVQGAEARSHAAALEQQSLLRWERVPVMPSEAPHAIAQLAEAEACFAVAGDRMGRTRAASTRRVYVAELLRRFSHARLMLRAATRDRLRSKAELVATETSPLSERAGAEERVAMAQRQLAILVALLERAPPSVWAYRDELSREARRYAASRPAHEREESGL